MVAAKFILVASFFLILSVSAIPVDPANPEDLDVDMDIDDGDYEDLTCAQPVLFDTDKPTPCEADDLEVELKEPGPEDIAMDKYPKIKVLAEPEGISGTFFCNADHRTLYVTKKEGSSCSASTLDTVAGGVAYHLVELFNNGVPGMSDEICTKGIDELNAKLQTAVMKVLCKE